MTFARTLPLLAVTLFASASHASADEVVPTIVTTGATTVVYVFPTSPQSFLPIASLPSFLAMPGAQLPPVATQVMYSVPLPAPAVAAAVTDLDCANFAGQVAVAGADVFNLDQDGDRVGCEPGER